MSATHEPRLASTVAIGSERSFGLVFAAVFTIVGAYPLLFGRDPRLWALALALGFAAAAFLAPNMLRPLNRAWFRLGLLLNAVVSPLVLGFLFFAVVTPTAVLMRIRGKDLLALRCDAGAASYWTVREPPGPAPETMRKQF